MADLAIQVKGLHKDFGDVQVVECLKTLSRDYPLLIITKGEKKEQKW